MQERDAELVVVGGGLAGVAAALEAAEAGIHVLLLEKLGETGGSSAMCSGCLAFAGTDLQRNQGIEDSDELLFRDLREVGALENDERIVRAYVRGQLDTYEWLRGIVAPVRRPAARGRCAPPPGPQGLHAGATHAGHCRRMGSLPSQPWATARIWSKVRRRVAVRSAISITVPGWPSFRK